MTRKGHFVLVGVLWLALSAVLLGYGLLSGPRLVVRWSTETEVETAGFNLYRADLPDGPGEQLNSQLIAAAGDPVVGADYSFVDTGIDSGRRYYYQLEEVELDGETNHGEWMDGEAPAGESWLIGLGSFSFLLGGFFLAKGFQPPPQPIAVGMADFGNETGK